MEVRRSRRDRQELHAAGSGLTSWRVGWTAEEDRRLEPYGLDALQRLPAHSPRRLPHWHYRSFLGDALTWTPHRRFDFVHTMLDLVPPRRRSEWLRRVLREYVAAGGRLIVRDYLGIRDRSGRGACRLQARQYSTAETSGRRPPGRTRSVNGLKQRR